MKRKFHLLVGAVAIPLSALALAQAKPDASAPAPAGPPYQSAFETYQPYQEVSVGDWRAANDAVVQSGMKAGADAARATSGMSAGNRSTPSSTSGATSHDAHHGSTK